MQFGALSRPPLGVVAISVVLAALMLAAIEPPIPIIPQTQPFGVFEGAFTPNTKLRNRCVGVQAVPYVRDTEGQVGGTASFDSMRGYSRGVWVCVSGDVVYGGLGWVGGGSRC